MKIYRFDSSVGHKVDRYGSRGVIISAIARLKAETVVSCMYIDRDGLVGQHQATAPQLFLVIHGEGWVRGQSDERIPIHAGNAAYWEKDERHESGSQNGMTVVILESESLSPAEFMQVLE